MMIHTYNSTHLQLQLQLQNYLSQQEKQHCRAALDFIQFNSIHGRPARGKEVSCPWMLCVSY